MVTREYSLEPMCSNWVGELDELPLEIEALGELLGQRDDAQPLGRVVARRDEGDSKLLGEVEGRLGRLAGEVQVVAGCGGLREVLAAAAGDDRHSLEVV